MIETSTVAPVATERTRVRVPLRFGEGFSTTEREYTVAAQMLKAVGVDGIRLLSNNPDKAVQLEELGIRVTERVPTEVHLSESNSRYLQAKRDDTAHTLDLSAA